MTESESTTTIYTSSLKNKNIIQRDNSIDIIRGFAILLMIQGHLFILVPYYGYLNNLITFISPAPLFLVVSGLSYELFIKSRSTKDSNRKLVFYEVIYRSLILLSIDLMMLFAGSIIAPSIYTFNVNWGVIQVIAIGYILGFLLSKNTNSKVILTIGLILLMIIFKFNVLNSLILFGPLIGLIPKLIYFQFGRIIHDSFEIINDKIQLLMISIFILSYNILFICLFNINISSGWINAHRWEFPIIIIITGNIYIFILVVKNIAYSHYLRSFLKPIERLGKISFTIYFAHVGLILIISICIKKFLPNVTIQPLFLSELLIWGIFAIIFATLEKYWKDSEYIFGFEWILRKGSKYLLNLTERRFYKNL